MVSNFGWRMRREKLARSKRVTAAQTNTAVTRKNIAVTRDKNWTGLKRANWIKNSFLKSKIQTERETASGKFLWTQLFSGESSKKKRNRNFKNNWPCFEGENFVTGTEKVCSAVLEQAQRVCKISQVFFDRLFRGKKTLFSLLSTGSEASTLGHRPQWLTLFRKFGLFCLLPKAVVSRV